MPEHSNVRHPHPFRTDADDDAVDYGPGVQVGAPDPDRGVRLDDLDTRPVDLDEDRPVRARRRTTGRTRKPAPTKGRGRSTSRTRKGSELALGAVVASALMAFGAYMLATRALGLGELVAIGAAGYVGGICSGGVVWPLWRAARHAVGRAITPKAGR